MYFTIPKTNLLDIKTSERPYILKERPLFYNPDYKSGQPIVRGGMQGRIDAAKDDVIRFTKFLADGGKGFLFITKQVGLHKMNPVTEMGTGSGIGGRLGLELDRISNDIPTRQWTPANTLAQLALNATGGHVVNHGLTPNANKGYIDYQLEKIRRGDTENEYSEINKRLFENPDELIIKQYPGGPQSFLGIGETTIYRTTFTNSTPPVYDRYIQSGYIDEQEKEVRNTKRAIETIRGYIQQQEQIVRDKGDGTRLNNTSNLSKRELEAVRDDRVVYDPANYAAKVELESEINKRPKYIDKNGDFSYKFGVNTKVTKRISRGFRDEGIGRKGIIYDKADVFHPEMEDYIRFKFELIDNSSPTNAHHLYFRCSIGENFTDSYSSNWNEIKYNGRGDSMFSYESSSRMIGMNFKVVAFSADEMQYMYQKLNMLASSLYPDYKNERMRGSLVRLTVGDYLFRQPGFISSLTYSPIENITWQIQRGHTLSNNGKNNYSLPIGIDVSMQFVPIHSFLPQKSENRSFFILPSNDGNRLNWLNSSKPKPATSTSKQNVKPKPATSTTNRLPTDANKIKNTKGNNIIKNQRK